MIDLARDRVVDVAHHPDQQSLRGVDARGTHRIWVAEVSRRGRLSFHELGERGLSEPGEALDGLAAASRAADHVEQPTSLTLSPDEEANGVPCLCARLEI